MKKISKKIIAFGAHPDDVEFGCGALLIKEIKNGNKVKIVICSLGEAGTNGTSEGRRLEAMNAAKFIGAEIEFLDLGGDCHIENKPEHAIKIAGILRKYKPQIVLAPSLSLNQHPDHSTVGALVRDACRFARYGGLKEIVGLKVHSIDALYYFQINAEIEGGLDIIIDVSEEAAKWWKAMSMHTSQMKTKSYLNLVSSKARALGASIGVEYALGLWVNDPVRLPDLSSLNVSSRHY